MRRFRCTVSYAGSAYEGWQTQRKGTSVQETIERVLQRVSGQAIRITGSGRTDAGVNAAGQVFMFDTDRDLTAYKWKGALNGLLPDDIHIMAVEETDALFHARYNVKRKQYVYRVNAGAYDVFARQTEYQYCRPLDIAKMKEAAAVLCGTHDFTSLNRTTFEEKEDQIRTIDSIEITERDGHITMTFTGKGFLRYQVRMMSAQIIDAGAGKITPEGILQILAARSKTATNRNAPACGLTLQKVEYFEMAALSEDGMVREFLAGDELPEGLTLKEAEEAVKQQRIPRTYIMTERNSQRCLAYVTVTGDSAEPVRYTWKDPAAAAIAQGLSAQIAEYIEKCVKTVHTKRKKD